MSVKKCTLEIDCNVKETNSAQVQRTHGFWSIRFDPGKIVRLIVALFASVCFQFRVHVSSFSLATLHVIDSKWCRLVCVCVKFPELCSLLFVLAFWRDNSLRDWFKLAFSLLFRCFFFVCVCVLFSDQALRFVKRQTMPQREKSLQSSYFNVTFGVHFIQNTHVILSP